jgi:hypothetical protein
MERVNTKITKKISSIEKLERLNLIPTIKPGYHIRYREIINNQIFKQMTYNFTDNLRIKIMFKL